MTSDNGHCRSHQISKPDNEPSDNGYCRSTSVQLLNNTWQRQYKPYNTYANTFCSIELARVTIAIVTRENLSEQDTVQGDDGNRHRHFQPQIKIADIVELTRKRVEDVSVYNYDDYSGTTVRT